MLIKSIQQPIEKKLIQCTKSIFHRDKIKCIYLEAKDLN